MKTNSTSSKRIIALVIALVLTFSLVACSAENSSDKSSTADIGVGDVIENPDADGLFFSGWDKKDDTDDNSSSTGTGTKDSKTMKESTLKMYGEIITVVKSVSNPTKPDSKNTSTTKYGTINWSTAAQGYVTFTATGSERVIILQGPNDGDKAIMTVAKGDTVKIALTDGTGKYQYAIGHNTADKTATYVDYKGSFTVSKIDSDLAPYLVSTAWGDFENAPNAVKAADDLWDTNKTQLDNVKAIAKYVKDNLKYDKTLKTGTTDVYVNPDKVLETGGGVCSEMSKVLVAMLRSQGIPAYYQSGYNAQGGGHGWVMAWLELSTETKNGMTYSTGAWVTIEAIGGSIQNKTSAAKNYTPSEYKN